MYYYLSRAVKNRLIIELQDSFSAHPEFKKLVPYIQNKFAYQEKPQYGIVVKNVSAAKVQMSADNFIGTLVSHCMKANVELASGLSAEWIREDTKAIRANNGVFPSPPGIYYVEMTAVDEKALNAEFVVDPLLSVVKEFLFEVSEDVPSMGHVATVSSELIHEGSLYVFSDHIRLVEGSHYTVDYATGQITFIYELPTYSILYADYHYPTTPRGPFEVKRNGFNNTSIPGVEIAFGRQMVVGDKFAVITTARRGITAQEFGGKWDISLSFDVLARDPIQLEEIADLVLMYIWAQKKNALEYEGLLIQDIGHGGEADEVYDETGQDMYYMVSMDLTIQTDWNLHIPVPFYISGIEFVEGSVDSTRTLSDEEIISVSSSLRVVPSLTPYMPKTGLTHNYERIA